MDHTPPNLPPLRDGRYALREPLGKGGMASVFVAFDHELATERAIKVVTYQSDEDDPRRTRLRREAQAMAQLCHPYVVQVYDIGSEGPVDYVVMELARGGSLADQLEQQGRLDPALAVGWTLDVLSALSAAHAAGIVHRDVKPQNILIDAQGHAMLADFGIALITGDEMRRTRTGVAMGSLAYMPPEQRLDAARVTHRADLYAVGSTLYRLLTHESAVDLFLAEAESPRWDGIDAALAEVIRRACANEPAHRYATALEFAQALAPWAAIGDRPFAEDVNPAWVVPSSGDYVPTVGPSDALAAETVSQPRSSAVPVGIALAVAAALLAAGIPWMVGRRAVSDSPVAVVEASLPPESPIDVAPASTGPLLEAAKPLAVEVLEPVRPRPMPAPEPVVEEASDAAFPMGRWSMIVNGVRLEVTLRGTPDMLSGYVTSRIKGRTEQHPVTGSYGGAGRVLRLRETDTGVRYRLTLEENEREGRGHVSRPDGGRAALVLQRG